VEKLEVELLMEAIFRHYGFDFRAYADVSLKRGSGAGQRQGLRTVRQLRTACSTTLR
jgi:chemotaxis protein methyltransferase CheR